MARIDNISEDWASATLSQDETWQAVTGSVLITDESSPATEDGIRLDLLAGIKIPSGKTIQYRRVGGSPASIGRVGF